MMADEFLQDQAQIARDIANDYKAFIKLLEQGPATKKAYNDQKLLLDDAFTRFKQNHDVIADSLSKEHEYFTTEKYESIAHTVEEFTELLYKPLKNLAEFKPDTINASTPERRKPEDFQNGSHSSIKEEENQDDPLIKNVNEMRRERKKMEVILDKLQNAGKSQDAKPTATAEIADFLFDLKKNQEDEVEPFDDSISKWLKFRSMLNVKQKP